MDSNSAAWAGSSYYTMVQLVSLMSSSEPKAPNRLVVSAQLFFVQNILDVLLKV
ncbi:unnamed protein product [Prunus brigantina]